MSEIGVKLSGDGSGFRSMLDRASIDAGKFAGDVVGKVGNKFAGIGAVTNTLATALGLNMQSIAEGVARLVLRMSKETEDMLKRIEQLSEQNAEASIRNMRASASEETKYQLALQKRESLLKKINDEHLGEVDAVGYVEDAILGQIAVIEKVVDVNKRNLAIQEMQKEVNEAQAEITAHENKLRDETRKKVEDTYKAAVDGSEKEHAAKLAILSTAGKINQLVGEIAVLQEQLVDGSTHENEVKDKTAQLQARTNELVSEQAKLEREIAEINAKNDEALEESLNKRVESQREQNSLQDQRAELLQNIATLEKQIDEGLALEWDMTKEIKLLDEARGKLKDVQKKQGEANVEIARLLLKGEENLTAEDKLRLQVLQGQTTQKKIEEEIAQILKKGAANLTDEDKARLAVLTGQSAELQEQIKKLAELNAAAKEFVLTLSRKGTEYEGQSTAALEGVRDRLKSQYDAVRSKNAMLPPSARDPFEEALRMELKAAEDELRLRRTVGNFANLRGEDAARAKYGDTLVERAVREQKDETTRLRVTMENFFDAFNRSIASTPRK